MREPSGAFIFRDESGSFAFEHDGPIYERIAEICEEHAGETDEEIDAAIQHFLQCEWTARQSHLN